MKQIALIAFLFVAGCIHAQENRFVDWPFLRDICSVDTNCVRYQTNHISSTTDSSFEGTTFVRAEKRNYNAKGQLVSIETSLKDTVEVLAYNIDAQGRIIMGSLFRGSGNDTIEFFKTDILKYDKQYSPQLQHSYIKYEKELAEKQFKDDRLIYKYSGSKAATHWYTDYVTDNYIRSRYDNAVYPWIQDQVCLHDKDTLYRRISYYNVKYNPARCETFIWANDSTKTETVVDALFNVIETITWVHGKTSEHHLYKTNYSNGNINTVEIINAMVTPNQRQYVIQYLPNETLVTPENGEAIHIPLKDEDLPPPPMPADYSGYTYQSHKQEGNFTRYDYFNFHRSTGPLLSIWYDEKGMMVKSIEGKINTRRSYQYN